MSSWCLPCSWNPSIPFYLLPPSVLHPASLATFCSHLNLEPFLVSNTGRPQMPLAVIIRMHPGRHSPRVILQSEQHHSEVQCVYMDGCLSRERGCNHCELFVWISHWWNSTLSYSSNSFFLVKIFQMFSFACTNRKTWLLTLVQEGVVFIWSQHC